MATITPRPTTTSAAATTITKNTIAWPPMSLSSRANDTKVRLTALSISSTHMNMISTLRRMSRPMAPMLNSAAAEREVPRSTSTVTSDLLGLLGFGDASSSATSSTAASAAASLGLGFGRLDSAM